MRAPAVPANEGERLRALRRYGVLDTEPEERFDALARLGAHIAGTPIGLVSLVDDERQWFKAKVGIEVAETPRSISFCGHVVAAEDEVVVEDARLDDRFADNPLVCGDPGVRFYAGFPLRTEDGFVLGTLCVIDNKPHVLDQVQLTMLGLLADQVVDQLEMGRKNASLRAQDANQAVLLDALPGLYVHLEEDGTILDVYGATRGDLTESPDDLFGCHLSEVLPPEASGPVLSALLRAAETMALETVRYPLEVDGVQEHFEARVANRGDGAFVAFVQRVTESVSAQKHREQQSALLEAIVRAQTRFLADSNSRAVFDGLLDDLLRFTGSEYGFIGEVLYTDEGAPYLKTQAITNIAWNAETRRFYDEHAPTGMEFHNLSTLFGAALTSGKPVIANHPGVDPRRGGLPAGHPDLNAFLGLPLYAGETMVGMAGIANRPGGYDERLLDTLRPLSITVARLIDIVRARRDRADALATLEESERRFRSIIDTATDAILTVDAEGVIQTANPSVELHFGYSPDELVGQRVGVLMPPGDRDPQNDLFASFVETGKPNLAAAGREVEGLRKNGETFPAELMVSEFRLQGKRYFTGAVRDISERKRVERLQSEFISTVSHELRTPLTSIRGSLGLVANGVLGELPQGVDEYVDIALANAERLVRLINDLLDFEKMQAGRIEMRWEQLAVEPVIREAVRANAGLAESLNVSMHVLEPIPHASIHVDLDRLVQVLSNLLSNAMKFSPRGGTVEVETTARDGRLRVSVHDRGPGVPEAFRDRLFEPFAQADGSSTRRQGGTGLGLSISRALMLQMQGTLEYSARPEGGSTFSVELPVAP